MQWEKLSRFLHRLFSNKTLVFILKRINDFVSSVAVIYMVVYRMIIVSITNLIKYGAEDDLKMILNTAFLMFWFNVLWSISIIHNEIDEFIERRYKK